MTYSALDSPGCMVFAEDRRREGGAKMDNKQESLELEYNIAAKGELEVAMGVINNFAAAISNADLKATLLLPTLCMGIASVYSQEDTIRATFTTPLPVGFVAAVLFVVLLLSILAAFGFLAATLTPRMTVPTGGLNSFAISSFTPKPWTEKTMPTRQGMDELCTQAWHQADALASIATSKFRYFRSALRCSYAALVAFLGWIGIMSLLLG